MVKIPTYTADTAPTEQVSSVKSNIAVSPSSSLAATLLPAAKDVEKYFIQEKIISNKVEGGKLLADANQELYEAQQKANLKSTPQEGMNYFNNRYNEVISKYKSKGSNNYIQRYFELNMNSNRPSYTNNILKTTRANMVKTRVDQVDLRVQNKIIAGTIAGGNFDFETLTQSVLQDYRELVDEGIIGESDFQIVKQGLPQEIEIGLIRNIAKNNAAEAIVILSDPTQLKQIPSSEKRKLVTEFGALLKIQEDVIKNSNSKFQLNSMKTIVEKFQTTDTIGISKEELENFKNGDIEFDNQVDELNNKIINKKFSTDTNFDTNTDIISKIYDGTITNLTDKFLLANETEPKSIIQRSGEGSINLNDVKYLSTVFTRSNNEQFKQEDQVFFKFVNDLQPLLQGNSFINFFDKQYNSKASTLRQTLYKRYVDGLFKGETPENLTTPSNENYIAKDITSYLPKTADLDKIVIDMAGGEILPNGFPVRENGEDANTYLSRLETFNEDETDLNLITEENPGIVKLWSRYYQTDESLLKEASALRNLSLEKNIPEIAKKAIDTAATIFEGDGGFTKETLKSYLSDIGQIETKYETKIQKGITVERTKFGARSYWQIEVTTAKDLLENAARLFGEKFEKQFGNYKGNFKTAREGLLNLSDKELTLIIEKDDALGASFAAAIIVSRFE
jgi:hypothetical protein